MLIAPSVLTADFSNLKNELDSIETADLIHIDIMDGHFVPNISFGPHITKSIAKLTDLKLDVHLMVSDPINWIDQFSIPEVEYITVHLESNGFEEAMDMIRTNGKKVGLSMKPSTHYDRILPYLDQIDLVLIMTVEPGFGGQSFMDDQLVKIIEMIQLKRRSNYQYLVEVDGGINFTTIQLCHLAGVDISVVGSYLFNLKDREKGIADLKICAL